MNNSDRYEYEALRYAELPCLPAPAEENGMVWIYAIAKTLSYSMSVGYAVVRNSYGESPKIIRSFGDGGVAKFTSIHPYKFLESRYCPTISGAAEMKAFLAKAYKVDKEKVAKLKNEALMKLFYNYCMTAQLADEDEKRKLEEARKESEAIRAREEEIRNQDKEQQDNEQGN